jgi:hypothetical protein
MTKLAVTLLAGADTPEAMGRMANALTTAKEAKDAGDDVRVLLDGAGTKWAAELRAEDHKYQRLFEDVRDRTGACVYYARAYGMFNQLDGAGIALLDEYKGHRALAVQRPSHGVSVEGPRQLVRRGGRRGAQRGRRLVLPKSKASSSQDPRSHRLLAWRRGSTRARRTVESTRGVRP